MIDNRGTFLEKYPILILKRKHLEEMVKKALDSHIEVCGFLIGIRDKRKMLFKAIEIEFVRNIENSPVKFTMDPKEIYQILMKLHERKMEIVGLFHSHPALSAPSSDDVKGMRLWNVPWLIINSYNGRYEAYMVVDHDEICKVKLKIINNTNI